MSNPPKAIIADDEEQLRSYLKLRLFDAWPELIICGEAANGKEAVEIITDFNPDIAFLDIRMPGLSGIEVAKKISNRCWVVFITSYDHYAVEAFENEAVDYLLKPVIPQRLEKTVARLKKRLDAALSPPGELSEIMERIISSLPEQKKIDYLKWIKAQHGDCIRLISVNDIFYFKSSEKYTLIFSKSGESLISKPIKQLAIELNPDQFWQIHRGTIVNVSHISKVSRSLTGKHVVKLNNVDELFTVSRTYAHLFKQM